MIRTVLCCFVFAALVGAQDLMPVPATLSRGQGKLAIDNSFRASIEGARDPRLEHAVARFVARLSKQTGIPFQPDPNRPATLVIECKDAGSDVQSVREDESYTLEVTEKQARITAPNPLGAMHGMETFLQLAEPGRPAFSVPAVKIEDKPRFAWRGLMIDVGRHFIPIAALERNIDGMAAVKLNVLHLHLSDDQGFRVESKQFPKLHGVGSDGLYYTQEDIRHIIEYARDRGVRIVPEFDMPGHTTAWFVGYPELASAPGPYQIERGWGIMDPAIDPTRDETYEFLDGLIGEMTALFPDAYFHIGGDEVNGKQWDANPRIQEFKRANNLKNNHELQSYFNKHLVEIVMKHGKKMVAWDEVLYPGLPKDVVVQSWRGQKTLGESARQGYEGLLSYGYYIDLMFSAAKHYTNDPMGGAAANLTEAEKARILGGEACMWTEFVDGDLLDARVWPRTAAIAERFWSPQSTTDIASMYRRLAITSARMEWIGLEHESNPRMMLERLAGYRPAPWLRVFMGAVEPVKEYARQELGSYLQSTPMNRMIDIAPAESNDAREFSQAVDALLAGDKAQAALVRKQSAGWRDQYAELKPVFETEPLAAELAPVSQDVSALGALALEALDHITSGKRAPQSWADAQSKLFARAKAARAELLVVILPPIQKLVKAAAGAK